MATVSEERAWLVLTRYASTQLALGVPVAMIGHLMYVRYGKILGSMSDRMVSEIETFLSWQH